MSLDASLPDWALSARRRWTHTGALRPAFADEPGPGQESVWDYPRPPRVEPERRCIRVVGGDLVLARTTAALRLLETAGPPTFYLPRADVDVGRLSLSERSSHCEWKGVSSYWSLIHEDRRIRHGVWSYPLPFPPYTELRDYFGFHPAHFECYVDDERARPQAGGFYAGWITSELTGPFKGEPGSEDW